MSDISSIERALRLSEEETQRQRRLYHAILSNTPDLAYVFDLDHRFIYANDTLLRVWGKTRSEAIGKTCAELGYEQWHAEMHDREIEQVKATKKPVRGEVPFYGTSGRRVYDYIFVPVLDEKGEVEAIAGTSRDITERRAEEDRAAILAEISELTRTASDQSQLLFTIATMVGEHMGARRCLFNEIDLENDREIVHRDYTNDVPSVAGVHPVSAYSPETSREMALGRTVVNNDAKSDPRTAHLYEQVYGPAGEVAYVAVPLLRDGKWVASLWISDDRPRVWTPGDVSFLEMVAERAWMALEKLRSEIEKQESEERFKKAFESGPLAVTITSLTTGKLVDVNETFVELTGYSKEEAIGRTTVELGLWANASDREAELAAVMKHGKIRDREYRFRIRNGQELVGLLSAELLDLRGEPCALTIIQDITERKRVEEALRESEETYRILADTASDAIIRIDQDSVIEYVNSAVKKIFGYEPHELIGKSLSVLMTEADGKRHREGLRRYAATGKRRMDWRGVLVNALHRDRHIFPLELSFGEYAKNGKRYFTGIARDVTERVNRENELRASEERRKLAQEAGNVGIWDWNVLEGRTYWSETMWSFYGEEPGDTNPDEEFWSAHIHPEDRSRVKGKLREIVASDAPEYHDEFRIVRGDGSVRWVESLAKIVRSEDGAATRMYGVNLDITERKNAEEIRRISENQLRVITDTVPALISYIDQDQRYRFVNQRYVEWFGGTKEDFIGKTIKDVAGSAAYQVVKPRAEAALRGEEVTFESLLKYESGDRYVRVSYVPDIALDGSVNGFFALVSDLTDLKRSQELLRSSEERLGTMIESLVDYAVIGLDSDGIIENWNRGAKIIFGYSPEEVCGKSFDMLFTQEDVSSGIPEAEVRKAAREGKATDERWHVRKDGGRFYASGVTISINVDGQLTGFAKILSDLTEKQRHAEELQQAHDELERRVEARTRELAEANKALIQEMQEREVAERQRVDLLRRLVSSQEMERRRIARDLHDQLGQRLTALRLKIASLKVACEDHEDIAERVERLQEISERLDAEVSFLAWELRPSALDDLGLVDSIGAFVQEWSRHYDIPADFHVSGPSRFRLDREVETHLYRITQEALNNIAKHAEATEVTVLLERRGSSLILIIEDNGIGFDADNTVTPAESGKGLGLLGMTERASIAGGEVEIESTQGSGTTIYVRVPFNDDHE